MPITPKPEALTPREREEFDQEKALIELQSAHTLRLKELELAITKEEMRWTQLLKLPVVALKVPVWLIFGLAFVVAQIAGRELPQAFWDFMEK